MNLRHASRTDVGRVREHNEDTFLADPDLRLFVVADGMGGRAAGEVASHLAVEAVREHVVAGRTAVDAFTTEGGAAARAGLTALMQGAGVAATQSVFAASLLETDRRGMGTTLTALLVAGDRAFVAHVGDSRAYLFRHGKSVQLTRDHSLIEELVLAGHLTREEAASGELDRLRCVLARAVGVSNDVAADVFDLEILPGDQFLLCSDGLTHYVDGDEMAKELGADLDAAVARMISLACERGGHDNVTAVALRFDSDAPADAARAALFDRKSDALSTVPLFHDLDAREYFHLLLAAETIDAAQDEILLREDQPIPALFFVLDGRVRLARHGGAAEDLEAGRWFGDAALVDRWVSAPTAVAVVPSRLVRLTRESLLLVSKREPEIASKVVAGFARATAERLRR